MLEAGTPESALNARPARQLTLRAILAGALLGGLLSLSNLYVALQTGWSIGVSITAGLAAFAIFAVLTRLRIVREPFGLLENNAMQSVASAAGYMTGGGTVAAIPALMMLTGNPLPGWQMFFWISTIAMLGVVMAIPLKQQLIDVEQLRFPTGLAAAETLKALHGGAGNVGQRPLAIATVVGALVGFFRRAHASWMPFNLPEQIAFQTSRWRLVIANRGLADYTLQFDTSLVLLAAGAIMGWRTAWSMMVGAIANYAICAPWLMEHGYIVGGGYKNIISWSVWVGSAMILTSGLLSFGFQWRTVLRAFQTLHNAVKGGPVNAADVPMSWFAIGLAILGPIVVFLQAYLFGIPWWCGFLALCLSFFIAIVAARATGETDNTPSGALGKITQITFGVLRPADVTTNLMTANVTAGVGLHAADLLTDLKSGWVLKADPRQQFLAQFFGVVAGSAFVVPAYRLLIPDASVLEDGTWPAPAAQTWKATAAMLANGVESLNEAQRWALLVGALVGIALVLAERAFPKARAYIPSATALGFAFTTPGYNTISMFLGGFIALLASRRWGTERAEGVMTPASSGLIASESLMSVFIAILAALGVLSKVG